MDETDEKVKTSPWPEPTYSRPSENEMIHWLTNEEDIRATDGCLVELDGICPHGHPSWLLHLNLL